MQRLVLLAALFDVAPSCGKRPERPPPPATTTTATPTPTATTKPVANTTPYAPCGGKKCGDTCSICSPTDTSCVETMEIKSCDASGACRSGSAKCP